MKKTSAAEPWLNCRRCGGSGTIAKTLPEDYMAEDSAPREVPLTRCDSCGGTGQIPPAKERE